MPRKVNQSKADDENLGLGCGGQNLPHARDG